MNPHRPSSLLAWWLIQWERTEPATQRSELNYIPSSFHRWTCHLCVSLRGSSIWISFTLHWRLLCPSVLLKKRLRNFIVATFVFSTLTYYLKWTLNQYSKAAHRFKLNPAEEGPLEMLVCTSFAAEWFIRLVSWNTVFVVVLILQKPQDWLLQSASRGSTRLRAKSTGSNCLKVPRYSWRYYFD